MTDDSSTCLLCGEPEELSIHDIWTDGNFQLATCCAGLLEQIASEIDADPAWGRALLRHLGAEELTGHILRRVSDGLGNAPVLDFKLCLTPVSFPVARAFIARHHRHCGPPHAWRFGSGVMNGSSLMGVVTVGNPVAPAFNGRGIVEVNRLCIRGDLDPMLRWNCCSKLYAYAAAEAERRGFTRIITYIRADEEGTSLRASGWVCDGPTGGRGWHSPRRARSNRNAWIAKERWSRALRPKPAVGARLKSPVTTDHSWLAAPRSSPGGIAL